MDQPVPSFGMIEWQADDGVRLAARVYGAGATAAMPLVCLPGLTRNARDFDAVARHFAGHPKVPRMVVAFDYRGRGASAWAPPASYTPEQERADILSGLAFLGISRAVFLGTSRGGLAVMLIAAARPELVAGAVLNDVGPTIDIPGLERILERMRAVRPMPDWETAVRTVAESYRTVYPTFAEADWHRLARQFCRDGEEGVVFDHDPDLVQVFEDFEPRSLQIDLWPAFAALGGKPVMVIRGALSDILSAATVEAMMRRHKGLVACVVPDQGHAPVLWERSILERIAQFLPA